MEGHRSVHLRCPLPLSKGACHAARGKARGREAIHSAFKVKATKRTVAKAKPKPSPSLLRVIEQPAPGSNNCHGSRGDTASELNEIGRDDGALKRACGNKKISHVHLIKS
jgi:hypothetical protein